MCASAVERDGDLSRLEKRIWSWSGRAIHVSRGVKMGGKSVTNVPEHELYIVIKFCERLSSCCCSFTVVVLMAD